MKSETLEAEERSNASQDRNGWTNVHGYACSERIMMMLLMMVMIIQADDDYNEDYDGDYDNEDDDEYDMSQQTFLQPLTIG